MKKIQFLTKLSPREKKILYIALSVILIAVSYHGILRPLQEKVVLLDDEIFSAEMKLRKAKIYIRQKDLILEEAKKYSNLAQLDAGTDEEETARILSMIEQSARKHGVSLSDVKPNPIKSDKWTKRFEVELNGECSLEQLTQFVFDLEHSAQMLKVEQVSTTPKEEKSPVLRSQMTVVRTVTT